MQTSGPDCNPRGEFSIDLRGTPFAPVKNTRWVSEGKYLHGNITGNITVIKTMINNHSELLN